MRLQTAIATILILLSTAGVQPAFAENLGSVLEEAGWAGLLGTWVDPDTRGEKYKVSYKWRYKDHVLEVVSKNGDKESTALIGYKAKSDSVFHMGTDNEGGSFIGEWKQEEDEAVLGLLFSAGDGSEGAVEIRHKLVASDTMHVKIMLDEPLTILLVRLEDK